MSMQKACDFFDRIVKSAETHIGQADLKTELANLILDLTDQEMAALEELAKQKDMSKSATIRQALRLYQLITERQKTHDMVWKDHKTGLITGSIVDLPPKMSPMFGVDS